MTLDLERRNCPAHPPVQGLFVNWHVTEYCNLECVHCLSDSGPFRGHDEDPDINALRRVASDMLAGGVTELGLGGGEPFSRPEIVDVIREADPETVKIVLVTNGYFLTPQMAQSLSDTALIQTYVSLDGHDAETAAIIRGKRGAFDKAVGAIKSLVAAGIPTAINHILHAKNVEHLQEFLAFGASLGPNFIQVSPIAPTGRGAQAHDLLLTPEQLDAAQAEFERITADPALTGPAYLWGADPQGATPDEDFLCGAGYEHLQVTGNGDVVACSFLRTLDPKYTVGNLNEEPFDVLLERAREVMTPRPTFCPARQA